MSSPPNGDTDAVLSVIGEHYTVERELGAGGMAREYQYSATTQSWWWRDLKSDPRYQDLVK